MGRIKGCRNSFSVKRFLEVLEELKQSRQEVERLKAENARLNQEIGGSIKTEADLLLDHAEDVKELNDILQKTINSFQKCDMENIELKRLGDQILVAMDTDIASDIEEALDAWRRFRED